MVATPAGVMVTAMCCHSFVVSALFAWTAAPDPLVPFNTWKPSDAPLRYSMMLLFGTLLPGTALLMSKIFWLVPDVEGLIQVSKLNPFEKFWNPSGRST